MIPTLLQAATESPWTTVTIAGMAIMGLYGIARLFLGRLPSAAKVEAGLAGAAAVTELREDIAELKATSTSSLERLEALEAQGKYMSDGRLARDIGVELHAKPMQVQIRTPSGGVRAVMEEEPGPNGPSRAERVG